MKISLETCRKKGNAKMTDDVKKLPLNAPAETEYEKKDAGAQGVCGYSYYVGGCGQMVRINKL